MSITEDPPIPPADPDAPQDPEAPEGPPAPPEPEPQPDEPEQVITIDPKADYTLNDASEAETDTIDLAVEPPKSGHPDDGGQTRLVAPGEPAFSTDIGGPPPAEGTFQLTGSWPAAHDSKIGGEYLLLVHAVQTGGSVKKGRKNMTLEVVTAVEVFEGTKVQDVMDRLGTLEDELEVVDEPLEEMPPGHVRVRDLVPGESYAFPADEDAGTEVLTVESVEPLGAGEYRIVFLEDDGGIPEPLETAGTDSYERVIYHDPAEDSSPRFEGKPPEQRHADNVEKAHALIGGTELRKMDRDALVEIADVLEVSLVGKKSDLVQRIEDAIAPAPEPPAKREAEVESW